MNVGLSLLKAHGFVLIEDRSSQVVIFFNIIS